MDPRSRARQLPRRRRLLAAARCQIQKPCLSISFSRFRRHPYLMGSFKLKKCAPPCSSMEERRPVQEQEPDEKSGEHLWPEVRRSILPDLKVPPDGFNQPEYCIKRRCYSECEEVGGVKAHTISNRGADGRWESKEHS